MNKVIESTYMRSIFRAHHPLRHLQSFKFAFSGILETFLNEPNFRVQFVLTVVVISLGFSFKVGFIEWAILIIALGALLSAELVNTAIEYMLDVLFVEYHDAAKIVKDVAAAFVLITACSSLCAILLIFGKIFVEHLL